MVGILTYGAYIPRYRIKVEEIAKVWGANAAEISGGLGVFEKSVPDLDEDAATIAVEAARNALLRKILVQCTLAVNPIPMRSSQLPVLLVKRSVPHRI
jgi:hypothetical protein